MEIILLKQICIMFLLILVGIFLVKKGYLSEQGGKDLGAILLRVVIPCVIVKSYITEYTPEKAAGLAISVGLVLLALGISMAVSFWFLEPAEGLKTSALLSATSASWEFRWFRPSWARRQFFTLLRSLPF